MHTTSVDKTMTPTYPIGSVDSALRLLLMVGERDVVRIADAAEQLGVARSTAHRLMQMLHYHGLVGQDPATKAYVAGPMLVGMGLQVIRRLDVRAVARPFMEQLVADVQETVLLTGARTDTDLVCLDSVESPRALRVGGRTGVVVTAHASAPGRALLATLPDEDVKRLYPRSSLPGQQTPNGERRRDLLEDLARTRERGYAIVRDDTEPNVSAVSAPIHTGEGPLSFFLTIMVPTSRLPDDDVPRMGEAVVRKAGEIATALPF